MTRLAVLIGVSDYDSQQKLPPCAKDIEAVYSILSHDNDRFDEILVLIGDTRSASVKEKLRAFLLPYGGAGVDELFFFFSGHGTVVDDEFRLVLTDFSSERPHETSLSNTELDGLARGVLPKLYVKIIDACSSGLQYIKDGSNIERDFPKGAGELKNCYFFFSSQDGQSSFADKDLSHFTRALGR